jgi:hypothetical protein
MGSFRWIVEGKIIEIIFSLIRNSRPIYASRSTKYTNAGELIGIRFDYLDYEDISVGIGDLDIENDDYHKELWNMLLQTSNVEAT